MESMERRARVHAALGEPARLAIVDRLVAGDASPRELGAAIGVGSNLLRASPAGAAGGRGVRRVRSEGDQRRTYVQLGLDDPLVRARCAPGRRCPVGPCGWCSCARTTRRVRSWRRRPGGGSARCRRLRRAPTRPRGCTRGGRGGSAARAAPGPADRPRRRTSSATATWSSRCATTRTRSSTRGGPAALVDAGPGAGRHGRGVRRRLSTRSAAGWLFSRPPITITSSNPTEEDALVTTPSGTPDHGSVADAAARRDPAGLEFDGDVRGRDHRWRSGSSRASPGSRSGVTWSTGCAECRTRSRSRRGQRGSARRAGTV